MSMTVNGTSGLTFPDTTTLASAGQASVRAWVNFNGTGTVAIRAAYNVASITDNGTGDYTVNFTTAMPDANYAATVTATYNSGSWGTLPASGTYTSSAVQVGNAGTAAFVDAATVNVSIFR
jgi:hypothetical protein